MLKLLGFTVVLAVALMLYKLPKPLPRLVVVGKPHISPVISLLTNPSGRNFAEVVQPGKFFACKDTGNGGGKDVDVRRRAGAWAIPMRGSQ